MKKVLLVLLTVFLSLIIIATASVLIVRDNGRQKLTETEKQPELPPVVSETPSEDESPEENTQEYSVRYNGKKYKYNDKMINVLLMGIDSAEPVEERELFGDGGQVDVLWLGCINTENKSVKIITIPRDTLCSIEVYDINGEPIGTETLPIALSHAFGDGGVKSAEMTVNAVSELLYGLQIHAWYSVNTLAIPVVNDAIGGVEVVADETNIDFMPSWANIGDKVLLKGNYAHRFIVPRFDTTDASRRVRQKQYMKSFIPTAKKAIKDNPLIVIDIYNKITEYSCTSLTLDEILWLSGEMLGMDIDTDAITLEGTEGTMGKYNTITLDETKLFEAMLDIFYLEVE